MDIRTELINAKVAGKLQEKTIEKLSSCLRSYQDYDNFVDLLEEKLASQYGRRQSSSGFSTIPPWPYEGFSSYKASDIPPKTPHVPPIKPSSEIFKNLLRAGTLAVLGLPLGVAGVKFLQYKAKHKKILDELAAQYPDKEKIKSIYKLITHFAPESSTNISFVKHVLDQLYNAPIFTAPMIKEIVEIEKGVGLKTSPVPATRDFAAVAKMLSDIG